MTQLSVRNVDSGEKCSFCSYWWFLRLYSNSDNFSLYVQTLAEFNITSDGWMEWRGNQYYLNRNSMYMEKARGFCKQRHGDLASITSKEENTFLWKQVSIYEFSVGVNIKSGSYHNYHVKLCMCACVFTDCQNVRVILYRTGSWCWWQLLVSTIPNTCQKNPVK